jgi:hypothetical protein
MEMVTTSSWRRVVRSVGRFGVLSIIRRRVESVARSAIAVVLSVRTSVREVVVRASRLRSFGG